MLDLTDNSQETSVVQFNGAGRVYQLISGSNGVADTSINTKWIYC
jgi:hypothetical protein